MPKFPTTGQAALRRRALAITGHDKPLPYPHTHAQSEAMRYYQDVNRQRAAKNPNEQWMGAKLKALNLKWTPQAMWGKRIFDWWCGLLGIAVEVDGASHDPAYDKYCDDWHFHRSAIVVLRVPNMDEIAAEIALEHIAFAETWLRRRTVMGVLTRKQENALGVKNPPVYAETSLF